MAGGGKSTRAVLLNHMKHITESNASEARDCRGQFFQREFSIQYAPKTQRFAQESTISSRVLLESLLELFFAALKIIGSQEALDHLQCALTHRARLAIVLRVQVHSVGAIHAYYERASVGTFRLTISACMFTTKFR